MSVNTRLFSGTSDWCSAFVWKHCAFAYSNHGNEVSWSWHIFVVTWWVFSQVGQQRLCFQQWHWCCWFCSARCNGTRAWSLQYIQTADCQCGCFKMESDRETWKQGCTKGKGSWIIDNTHVVTIAPDYKSISLRAPAWIWFVDIDDFKGNNSPYSSNQEQIVPYADTYNV